MRFVWISALKDLRILRRDPFSVLTWVGIPLCIGLLIHLVFGGSGGQAQPQGVLLVADQDDTFASRMLAGAFGSEPWGRCSRSKRWTRRKGARASIAGTGRRS